MRHLTIAALAAGASLLACQAFAQAPEEDDDEQIEVSELVVMPSTPGPAWWKVSDADSAVYILVAPENAPKGLAWDQSVLERRMYGAHRLILPLGFSLLNPESIAGIASVIVQLPKLAVLLDQDKPPKRAKDAPLLEDALPEATRDRFVAARTNLQQPAERYAQMTPEQAARRIEGDYRQRAGFARGEIADAVKAAAKRNNVRTETVAKVTIPIANVKVATARKPGLEGAACVDATLTSMVARVAAQRKVAEAWAVGDVRPLVDRQAERRIPVCAHNEASISLGENASNRLIGDLMNDATVTLEKAMKTPGRSVALLDASLMLRKDGVLERLRAKGYKIDTPASLEDED